MRCLRHVFSWLTQCNQAFPLTDCSEENPVPYSAGNRDHRVTDGTQNRTSHRGNTDALRRVKYPVHRTGKLFTGLPPDRFRAQLVLQAGHQGTGGMVGKCCHERTDQRIQFPAGAGRYGHNRMYGPEQPVRADTATTGCTGRNSRNTASVFSRMFCACAGEG